MDGYMKKWNCLLLLLCILLMSSFAGELQKVIPPEDGMIEYFFFIDGGWGIDDPYSYDWSKGVDESGDEYVMAKSNSFFSTIYVFYNLSENKLEEEYDYWTSMAIKLKRDKDENTNGSIKDEYIFLNLPNTDKRTFPYSDYIGHKFYFMNVQRIPYTKFNMVWEYGSSVIDI